MPKIIPKTILLAYKSHHQKTVFSFKIAIYKIFGSKIKNREATVLNFFSSPFKVAQKQ